jgi:hypothetical protein
LGGERRREERERETGEEKRRTYTTRCNFPRVRERERVETGSRYSGVNKETSCCAVLCWAVLSSKDGRGRAEERERERERMSEEIDDKRGRNCATIREENLLITI